MIKTPRLKNWRHDPQKSSKVQWKRSFLDEFPIKTPIFLGDFMASHVWKVVYESKNYSRPARNAWEDQCSESSYARWCLGRPWRMVQGSMFGHVNAAVFNIHPWNHPTQGMTIHWSICFTPNDSGTSGATLEVLWNNYWWFQMTHLGSSSVITPVIIEALNG